MATHTNLMQSTYLLESSGRPRCSLLFSQNYHIRERNYCYRKAEVDLIVQKGNLLVAVEVKARSTAFLVLQKPLSGPNRGTYLDGDG